MFPIASIPVGRHVYLKARVEDSQIIDAGIFQDGSVTTDMGEKYPVEIYSEWAPMDDRCQCSTCTRLEATEENSGTQPIKATTTKAW